MQRQTGPKQQLSAHGDASSQCQRKAITQAIAWKTLFTQCVQFLFAETHSIDKLGTRAPTDLELKEPASGPPQHPSLQYEVSMLHNLDG